MMHKPWGIRASLWLVCGTLMAGLAGGGLVGAGQAHAADFAYAGDAGPGFWAELDPAWEACAGAGGRQSPIDLSHVVVDPELEPLQLEVEPTPIALLNNGHVIEEAYELGSTLRFEGVVYHLEQFHFHTLSEHTVRGHYGAMELHAVFKDDLVNTTKIAVVGMRYTIGRDNRFLAALLAHGLPEKAGDHVDAADAINLADGLTNTAAYYTYPGSLTTPPCSENVTWIVLKKVAELSPQQFEAFRHILGNDFRPLQERNGRVVRVTRGGKGHTGD
jgi:carbonic anhydrase